MPDAFRHDVQKSIAPNRGQVAEANNEAATRGTTKKPASFVRLLWERHSCPMRFGTMRRRASPPRGDKWLKPLPTTKQRRGES